MPFGRWTEEATPATECFYPCEDRANCRYLLAQAAATTTAPVRWFMVARLTAITVVRAQAAGTMPKKSQIVPTVHIRKESKPGLG